MCTDLGHVCTTVHILLVQLAAVHKRHSKLGEIPAASHQSAGHLAQCGLAGVDGEKRRLQASRKCVSHGSSEILRGLAVHVLTGWERYEVDVEMRWLYEPRRRGISIKLLVVAQDLTLPIREAGVVLLGKIGSRAPGAGGRGEHLWIKGWSGGLAEERGLCRRLRVLTGEDGRWRDHPSVAIDRGG